MSSGLEKIEKLGYRVVALKSADDVKKAKLNAKIDDLCSGEVSGKWAAGLFEGDDKNILQAFKIVKKGDAKMTDGILMFVSPMRVYENDEMSKVLNENSKELGFDQLKQHNDAMELLVFCVREGARKKGLGARMLLHAVELANKKYVVVGQELGPASEGASKFYSSLFPKSVEGSNDGKMFRFYAGLSSDVAKSLGGDLAPTSASKPAKKPASKPAKKPAAAKKPAVAGKRRRAAVCGKVVRRSDSFLNSVGKTFKELKTGVKSTLSMKAACSIDAILRETLEGVGSSINSLLQSNNSKTANVRTVQTALRLRFGAAKEVLKFMLARGVAAETKLKQAAAKKRSSVAMRAGLSISPARVARLLRESRAAPRVGFLGALHLAGALQYLCEELIGNSLEMIQQSKKKTGRVTPRVLMFVVSQDEELNKMFRGTIGGAGVVPSVEAVKKPKTK